MIYARIILGSIALLAGILGILAQRNHSGILSMKLFALCMTAFAFFVYPNHIVEGFRTAPKFHVIVWAVLGVFLLLLFFVAVYFDPLIEFLRSVFGVPPTQS